MRRGRREQGKTRDLFEPSDRQSTSCPCSLVQVYKPTKRVIFDDFEVNFIVRRVQWIHTPIVRQNDFQKATASAPGDAHSHKQRGFFTNFFWRPFIYFYFLILWRPHFWEF